MRKLLNNAAKHLDNQRGLTLVEMLVALLLFILASILIVTAVSSVMDRPKEAGVRSVFSSYEDSAELLLLDTGGNIPGAAEANWISELSAEVDPTLAFTVVGAGGVIRDSVNKNAWNNVYSAAIAKDVPNRKASVIVTTVGKKATTIYTLGVYYKDGELYTCTKGLGRNDKKLPAGISTGDVCGAPQS